MTTEVKIITLKQLGLYDGLVKKYVNDADAKSIKSVKIEDRTLKFYKVEEPIEEGTLPAYSIDIPETDLTAVNEAIKAVKDVVDKLDGADSVEGSVKAQIKAAKTELEGKITANADAIQAHKDAIDAKVTTLVGEDADKSVRTIANEELTAQLIPENAKESLNTLQEIAAWIQKHPDDASAMNQAITALQSLVGTIPEDATAKDIVAYIKEVVDAEKTRATGIETGLDTRLKTVEGLVSDGGGSVDDKIATAKQEAIDTASADAKTKADTAEKNVKAYADSLAVNYATAEQGKKADSALQEKDVTDLRTDVSDVKASLAEGGDTAKAIADAKKAGDDAQADVDALAERVDTIESTKYIEATDEEINSLFA